MGTYRGSKGFYEKDTNKIPRKHIKPFCLNHDCEYIYKATGNCMQGILRKETCDIRGEEHG
jgi:hypothetical protein